MMNFGFSTYFFVRKKISDVIDDIVASGIRTIEVSFEIPHALDMDGNFLSKINPLKLAGIEFSMHAPFYEINLGSFFADHRHYAIKRLKSALDMACSIGCNPVVVHPGYTMLAGKARDIEDLTRANFIEDLREISGYARERGLKIALENVHVPFFFFYELNQFKKLHKSVPDIGITLDIGHAFIAKRTQGEKDPEGSIIQDIREVGIEHLFHVHLHNNRGVKDDHLFPEGHIDLKRILQALNEMGYNGKVIIESYEIEERGIDAVLQKLEEISP